MGAGMAGVGGVVVLQRQLDCAGPLVEQAQRLPERARLLHLAVQPRRLCRYLAQRGNVRLPASGSHRMMMQLRLILQRTHAHTDSRRVSRLLLVQPRPSKRILSHQDQLTYDGASIIQEYS